MKKLRFYLNKEFDKIMAEQFLDEKGGGIDFSRNILRKHPDLKVAKVNIQHRKKIISDYFNAYYRVHRSEIQQKVKRVKSMWAIQELEYITATEDYFDGFPFPSGKYIAYASIIDCNPRFLEQKTFQFFYKKPVADIIYTIAHELLHFIFFDFIKRKMKKETRTLSQDQLWDLSEIFNIVVLKSSRYTHIIDQRFVIPYPNHRELISSFEKEYKKSKNAQDFIRLGIGILKK